MASPHSDIEPPVADESQSLENESSCGSASSPGEEDTSERLAKPRSNNARIVINVSDTQYPVVRQVSKKVFHWRLSFDLEDTDFDLWWTDNAVQPEKLAKMKPYQKINHFPGMYGLARKNYLARNLTKLRRVFPEELNFFPVTWVLPAEYAELKSYAVKNPRSTFIVKPEASCQGRGIFLTRSPDDLDPTDRFVVQRYIEKPFLIDDLKFDLRIYVLVTGCDPLRIFVHEEGLTRLATEEYVPPSGSNLSDICMHLTNYAVNKNNPNFIFNEDSEEDDIGHKRSLTSTMKVTVPQLLEDLGHDVGALQRSIADIIVKTLCSVQPSLAHVYRSCQPEDRSNACCFEILGFDIMLDHWLKPWLLEVNHSPSFTTDTPLDKKIKKRVISEALTLVNMNAKHKRRWLARKKTEIQQRAVLGKTAKVTKEEKEAAVLKATRIRDKWEAKHSGGYTKIYPTEDSGYEKFMKAASDLWEEWTGGNISRVRKEDGKLDQSKKPPRKPSKVILMRPSDVPRPAKSPNASSVSTRDQRSNSTSEQETTVVQEEKQVIPAVFQRLTKAKPGHRRDPTPIVTLPNIYFADDVNTNVIYVSPDRIYRPFEVSAKPKQYPIIYATGKERKKLTLAATMEASMKDRLQRKDVLHTPLKIQSLVTDKQLEPATSSGSFIVPRTMDFSQFEAFTPSRKARREVGFFEGKRLKKT